MNYNDKLGEARSLFEQAEVLLTKEDPTAEELEQAEKMVTEAQEIKATGLKLKEINMSAKELEVEMSKVVETKEASKSVGKKDFKDWPEFLHACYKAGHREPTFRERDSRLTYFDEKEPGQESKQMVESVGASGGFLVPVQFLAQLQAVLAEDSIVRSRATVIRMNRRQLDIPVLDQTGTTAGQPHWFGGMLSYWAEEATEKTISTAEFRKITLTAHKLIMYTRASDELLDDSAISIADFLAGPLGFAGNIAWEEDYTFLQGTGAGQPLGILNAGATRGVARAAAGAIGYADLVNMLEAFLPSAKGVWVVTHTGLSNLMQLVDPNGNYIWQPNAREGTPQVLFGMPVYFTEKLPAVGTRGDVMLADFRYYLVGDRQATTVESTQFDFWRFDQTSWRAVHRVDGQPWLSTHLTFADGASTVSPFVVLDDVTS